MFERFLPEANQIPLVTLPITFKKRVIQLAYIPDLKNLRKTCPEIRRYCHDRPREIDQLYFTDDATHYQNAKYYRWFFQKFKYIYKWLGSVHYIYPTWQHFGNLKAAKKYKLKLYVTDILVLYCAASDSCDKFIPHLCGPYTCISIRGHVRWDQVKRLIHPNVKKIHILAQIEFNETEYDEFAQFIKDHLSGGYEKK
uniref:F-box domain-containing protein n=1 Tax=Panagrellus redivivus TaxID=6233 RepID=A0A7E4V9J9_PANRE